MAEELKKKLLIYYPPNKRAIALNAVISLLKNDAEIYLLTQEPHGQLHEDLEQQCEGYTKIFASSVKESHGLLFYYKHIKSLIQFCRKNKIDVVFSHLQIGNLVAVIASRFLPHVKFYFFRHHFQYFKKFRVDYLKSNRNERLGEMIVNHLSEKIIVPSTTVLQGMVQYEKVKPEKIELIPYIYNFNEYPSLDFEHINTIREKYSCHLLLLMSSRFIEAKRHALVINVVASLISNESLDIKLLLLDDGPLRQNIEILVETLNLNKNIFFVGYTNRIMDYMAASDLLVHPSLSEASNSSVKEMAIAGGTAVVCTGVGDFDDYIVHNENGFLIDPLESEFQLKEVFLSAYKNKEALQEMAGKLKEKVIEKFSPNKQILRRYQSLLHG